LNLASNIAQHLPIGADTFIGNNIFETIGGVGGKIVVLPYIWFGFSQHHVDLKGL
jgi:creatinine amidohydrolase/Fe(II)-dependent formamide hydrolase-like protein